MREKIFKKEKGDFGGTCSIKDTYVKCKALNFKFIEYKLSKV